MVKGDGFLEKILAAAEEKMVVLDDWWVPLITISAYYEK